MSLGPVGGHPGTGQGFADMSSKGELWGARAAVSHGGVLSLLAPTFPGILWEASLMI